MWHKSSGEKKKCEETDMADVSLGPLGAFWGNVLLWTRGDRKRCIYVKHQRARGQLVKQMRERIPEKEEKRTVWRSTKHESIQHKHDKKIIQTVQFALVKELEERKTNTHTEAFCFIHKIWFKLKTQENHLRLMLRKLHRRRRVFALTQVSCPTHPQWISHRRALCGGLGLQSWNQFGSCALYASNHSDWAIYQMLCEDMSLENQAKPLISFRCKEISYF